VAGVDDEWKEETMADYNPKLRPVGQPPARVRQPGQLTYCDLCGNELQPEDYDLICCAGAAREDAKAQEAAQEGMSPMDPEEFNRRYPQ
jgi:hypothetical protein